MTALLRFTAHPLDAASPRFLPAAQALVSSFLETFAAFPPRQKAASFAIDQAMEKMERPVSGYGH